MARSYTAAEYAAAMELKGTKLYLASVTLGIPEGTLWGWWHQGKRPKVFHMAPAGARQATLRTASARYVARHPERRAETQRQHELRRRGVYHSVFNPDPLLIPLHQLWYPTPAVVALIVARYGSMENATAEILASKGKPSGERQALYRMQAWPDWQRWIRADTTDRLLCSLGMLLVELDAEPIPSDTGVRTRPSWAPEELERAS